MRLIIGILLMGCVHGLCQGPQLELGIDRSKMRPGQTSRVQLRLTGLDPEMNGQMLLVLRIDNPGAAVFPNGQGSMQLVIDPGEIRPDGTLSRVLQIQALAPGRYQIHAELTVIPLEE